MKESKVFWNAGTNPSEKYFVNFEMTGESIIGGPKGASDHLKTKFIFIIQSILLKGKVLQRLPTGLHIEFGEESCIIM